MGYVDGGLVSILDVDTNTGTVETRSSEKRRVYQDSSQSQRYLSSSSCRMVGSWRCIFTFRMAFINLRGFSHAIAVTAGQYDSEEDEGEVSHFQALSSALSATVGWGTFAGVAVAVAVGGPGAIVWMVIAGFLGNVIKVCRMYTWTDVSKRRCKKEMCRVDPCTTCMMG